MKVYLYAKSGHAIGLEATKRCASIVNALKEFEPVLCTSDFRAGAFAKDLFGIKKYVNIDVVRNLYNIMEKRDILIYDTDEVNELMKKDMQEFCTLSYSIGEDITDVIVDETIYTKIQNPSIEKLIFFGDDDYNKIFFDMIEASSSYDIDLLMGHYFFLGNEKVFNKHFKNVIDEEEYVDTIKNTKFLLTASLQTALESISCGNSPVLFKRTDKNYDEDLIEKINIPVIKEESLSIIINSFENIIKKYPNLNSIKIADISELKSKVSLEIEAYTKIIGK